MRAWRRETFASGSSESRSTSGKIPPSASQRPICDSASLNMNFFPVERPRSITRQACGWTTDFGGTETLNTGEGWLVTNSGFRLPETALRPLPSMPGLPPGLECGLGFKGAPHSSQYCEPSRFSVLHLSHEIIEFRAAGQLLR